LYANGMEYRDFKEVWLDKWFDNFKKLSNLEFFVSSGKKIKE
jgi:hypothetical protein